MTARTRLQGQRPAPEFIARFADLAASTVYEAAGKTGAMQHDMRPLVTCMRVCGSALPVWCPTGDNLTLHQAVAVAQPGDVLVADVGGDLEAGGWGEILTVAAMERRLGGLVTNGAVRDVTRLRALQFPVFCRGISMKATTKVHLGTVGQPICCGGVYVRPGDLVLGDDDGIVVVAYERLEETLERALERVHREEALLASLKQGKTTLELLGLKGALTGPGSAEEWSRG